MTRTFLLSLMMLLMLSGCARHTGQPKTIVLATPLQISYHSEATLVRIGQLIESGQYQHDQLSQLYYERGVMFSHMGLGAMARLDFSHAIHITPDFAPAYDFLGLYYLSREEFDNAYEAFDSSIELDPDFTYAYFSRAVALYYGHKYRLAIKDIRRYRALTPDDPYRSVWLYLIEMKINPEQARQHLQETFKAHEHSHDWGWQIVALLAGKLSDQDFIHQAGYSQNNQQLAEHLCEAYFYLGKKMQIEHRDLLARSYFKLSVANNVYSYVEHRLSLLELRIEKERKEMQPREL